LGSRARCIAHPNPHQAISRRGGVIANADGSRRSVLHARYAHAIASAIEDESMISALYFVVLQPAHGKRQLAVWTSILKRDRLAILGAIEHDVLPEKPYSS